MQLGAFSISLAVKDIDASLAFYEKFGFKVFTGDAAQRWLIVENGEHAHYQCDRRREDQFRTYLFL
jgi:lactoylglutathione lyase